MNEYIALFHVEHSNLPLQLSRHTLAECLEPTFKCSENERLLIFIIFMIDGCWVKYAISTFQFIILNHRIITIPIKKDCFSRMIERHWLN